MLGLAVHKFTVLYCNVGSFIMKDEYGFRFLRLPDELSPQYGKAFEGFDFIGIFTRGHRKASRRCLVLVSGDKVGIYAFRGWYYDILRFVAEKLSQQVSIDPFDKM